MTGFVSIATSTERERLVQDAAELLRTEPDEVLAAIGRLADRRPRGREGVQRLKQQSSDAEATALAEAAAADGGVVVAPATRSTPIRCAPSPRPFCVMTACGPWCSPGHPISEEGGDRRRHRGQPRAGQLLRTLGPLVGGGGGGSPQLATAGGKDPSGIEAALGEAQRLLSA